MHNLLKVVNWVNSAHSAQEDLCYVGVGDPSNNVIYLKSH